MDMVVYELTMPWRVASIIGGSAGPANGEGACMIKSWQCLLKDRVTPSKSSWQVLGSCWRDIWRRMVGKDSRIAVASVRGCRMGPTVLMSLYRTAS